MLHIHPPLPDFIAALLKALRILVIFVKVNKTYIDFLYTVKKINCSYLVNFQGVCIVVLYYEYFFVQVNFYFLFKLNGVKGHMAEKRAAERAWIWIFLK